MFDFGLVGLGVMGRNFILNVASKGFSAIGLSSKDEAINLLKREGVDYRVDGTKSDEEFIKKLSRPRKIMLLVPAGNPVDTVIERFLPYLDEGDIIIDGGNSHYDDTDRRYLYLKNKNIHFIGAGVSGGSKGARFGPSIMPGGDKECYKEIQPIFEAAAAKVKEEPCVSYLGITSSGHYVKMIHNGIEYAIMQLISENYHVLKYGLKRSNDEIHKIFKSWNEGLLESYLVEISRDIFKAKDSETGSDLIDVILDNTKFLQDGTPKFKEKAIFLFGPEDQYRPEAMRYREYVKKFRTKKDVLVVTRDPNVKPVFTSYEYKRMKRKFKDPDSIQFCNYNPFLGIIPIEISDVFPASHYVMVRKKFNVEDFPTFTQNWTEFFKKNKFKTVYLPKDDLFLQKLKKLIPKGTVKKQFVV